MKKRDLKIQAPQSQSLPMKTPDPYAKRQSSFFSMADVGWWAAGFVAIAVLTALIIASRG